MKRIAIALLFVLVAVSAQAATIYDIQTGVYVDGDIVDLNGVTVTALRYNGVWVAEAPFGPNNGIWIYGPADLLEGDIIDVIGGEYKEYYGLSEVDASGATVTVVGAGEVPAPIVVSAMDLWGVDADPEPYESCLVIVADGMYVTEILSNGMWAAVAVDGTPVLFDDYFYDESTVLVDDCYDNATGIFDFNWDEWKLQAFVDGIEMCEGAVAVEEMSFEAVKALYR